MDFEMPPCTVANPWLLPTAGAAFSSSEDLAEKLSAAYQPRVGNQPIARDLKALMAKQNLTVPADIAVLSGDVYLVTHGVGIVAQDKPGAIKQIGLEAELTTAGSTIELVPSTSFRTLLTAGIGFSGALAANGQIRAPLGAGDLSQSKIGLGADAELQLAAKGGLVGNLSLSILSSLVEAVGQSSSSVTWQIHKDQKPLVGDQILVQTLVVPAGTKVIGFRLRGYAIIDPGWFKRDVRVQSDWVAAQAVM